MGHVEEFLAKPIGQSQALLTRAVRLLRAATIRPAHAKPPHPTWITAVRQIIRCYQNIAVASLLP